MNCKKWKTGEPKYQIQGKHIEGPILQISINNSDCLLEIIHPLFQDLPRMKVPIPTLPKVRHNIDAGDSSAAYAKVRQMSEEKLIAAKEEFTTLLQAGIIRQTLLGHS